MEKLLAFINSLSPSEREHFASTCRTTIGYLRKAISAGQELRPDLCVRIERYPGCPVGRIDLRPRDWFENWPELVAASPPRAPLQEEGV
ncbi:Hypothetical protein Bxe_A3088 [Paraburkholderia xenovorans LB400]|uniref:Helix-turn-helix domain-containing protein n=1 Tax=Paraburkholderia xenovorans (strain LB400) TaxID=266265 RepID=Q141U8_PARXL|nr:Hypothetical protein Bxe_A3088 [Paraburkholderia xenovorans LB400]